MNEMNYQGQNPNEAQQQQQDMGSGAQAVKPSMKIDDKAVAKMAGEAISQVDGVLGIQGGLTDLLKNSDDKTTGISVSLQGENKADVSVKLITEFGKNIPQIVDQVTGKIAETLMNMAGLTANKVEVEVTDTMTQEEYEDKRNNNSRPLH